MEYLKKHSKTKLNFTSKVKKYEQSNVEFELVTEYSRFQHPELPKLGKTVIYDFLEDYFKTLKLG